MFNLTSAEKNRLEQRAIAQVATYESIKAKIDRGINRQTEGRKEVQDGLREMIETKSYLKKYKTIAAFAENEYGKSKSWVYEQIKAVVPENECEKGLTEIEAARVHQVDDVPDKHHKSALESVKEEEPEKPAVHSSDEKDYEVKPTNGHVAKPKLENGKPKQSLAAWREMEESLIGRALNRADELNRQCPNPQFHAKLIASLKVALTLLEQWKASVL